jgi:hypothetical protein
VNDSQSITITPRKPQTVGTFPAARITAMISSTVGEVGG